jgi:hypothetical protein
LPHLMLSFNADREVSEIAGQLVPTGKESIDIKMMDTDQGQVVELKIDAKSIDHVERKPTHGELTLASRTLGKEPGVNKEELERLRLRTTELERKLDKLNADLVGKNKLVVQLNGEVAELQRKEINNKGRTLLASSLDGHIADLAAKGQYETYEQAKILYKQLTGISWVDEGDEDDDDDDEEGD